jgi:hypothetical protein
MIRLCVGSKVYERLLGSLVGVRIDFLRLWVVLGGFPDMLLKGTVCNVYIVGSPGGETAMGMRASIAALFSFQGNGIYFHYSALRQ